MAERPHDRSFSLENVTKFLQTPKHSFNSPSLLSNDSLPSFELHGTCSVGAVVALICQSAISYMQKGSATEPSIFAISVANSSGIAIIY